VPASGAAASAWTAPDMLELPCVDLGKRDRGTDNLDDEELRSGDGHGLGLRKRAKSATIGVLEAEGTTNRTRHNSAVKEPAEINTTSKAVECRADVLMITSAQGGSDRLPQVPSVQQESTGTTAQERLPLVGESTQGATWAQCDSVVRQEGEEVHSVEDCELGPTENNIIYIPKRLDKNHEPFLEAAPEEIARGFVYVLKCTLCPSTNLSTWDDFVRHCKTTEAHPLKIFFCDHCGTFFARRDSLRRHSKKRPSYCLRVSPRDARDKCKETKRMHEEFKKTLEGYLETKEGNCKPFAQIVKERYPKSSKRGSRLQSCLQATQSGSS
jgi:hypothetical protein